jgi:Transglutaminase-like superfamily
MLTRLRHKLATARRQDRLVLLWVGPAWVLLGLSRFIIITLSFRRFARWLGVHDGLTPRRPAASAAQQAKARSIGRAIAIAAKYTPWTSNCFPQAITARVILGAHAVPYALFFGLARDKHSRDLKAHAWTVSGDVNITGGESFSQFTVVGSFVSDRHSPD